MINDEENIFRVLRNLFNEKENETKIVMTGEEALDRINESYFNDAFIDINLLDREGIDLVDHLRRYILIWKLC